MIQTLGDSLLEYRLSSSKSPTTKTTTLSSSSKKTYYKTFSKEATILSLPPEARDSGQYYLISPLLVKVFFMIPFVFFGIAVVNNFILYLRPTSFHGSKTIPTIMVFA